MIHIYCGDGKGKTTAAMGLALRMAGAGGKVLIGQFFKDGSSSEIASLRRIPEITVLHCPTIPGRYIRLTPEQRTQVQQDYTAYFRDLLEKSKDYDLLILDEVISACNHETIPQQELLTFLQTHGSHLEIALTGRNPHPSLCTLADYISTIQNQKHPFQTGAPARKGIEY